MGLRNDHRREAKNTWALHITETTDYVSLSPLRISNHTQTTGL